MQIRKPEFEVLAMTGHLELPYRYFDHPEVLMEVGGRNCYKSEKKITPTSAKAFVEMIKKNKHLTVQEHSWEARLYFDSRGLKKLPSGNWCKYLYFSEYEPIIAGNLRAWHEAIKKQPALEEMAYVVVKESDLRELAIRNNEPFLMRATVRVVCDRGVSHELVRHRPPAFSQECVSGDTIIKKNGPNETLTIKQLYERSIGSRYDKTHNKTIYLRSCNENGDIIPNKVNQVFFKGIQNTYKLTTKLGYQIRCTQKHKFLKDGNKYIELKDLNIGDKIYVNGRPSLVKFPDEQLKIMYLDEGFCPQEIADICIAPYNSVIRKLKQLGIFKRRLNDKNKEKYLKNHDSKSIEKMRSTILNGYQNGRKVWNKGLKESEHPSVKIQADSLRQHHYNNETGENNSNYKNGISTYRNSKEDVETCEICGGNSEKGYHIHHKNFDRNNNDKENLLKLCPDCHILCHHGWHVGKKAILDEISSIEEYGQEEVYDIEMKDPYHNYIADGFITHNSTRYVNYQKKGTEFIEPLWLEKSRIGAFLWNSACKYSSMFYNLLLKAGWSAQEARSVLPNSLKTEVIFSATLEEFQHIFNQRYFGTTGKPHPQMFELMSLGVWKFAELEPDFFGIKIVK